MHEPEPLPSSVSTGHGFPLVFRAGRAGSQLAMLNAVGNLGNFGNLIAWSAAENALSLRRVLHVACRLAILLGPWAFPPDMLPMHSRGKLKTHASIENHQFGNAVAESFADDLRVVGGRCRLVAIGPAAPAVPSSACGRSQCRA